MSNFLDNLVARTLDLTPVVQPRITSRFEPLNAETPAAPDQVVEVEAPAPASAEPRLTTRPEPSVVERERVERVESQRVINTIRNTQVQTHEVRQVSAPPIVEKIREREIERSTVIEPRIHTDKTDLITQIRENRIVEPARESEPPKPNPPNPRPNIVEPAPLTVIPQPIVPQIVTRVEPAPLAPSTPRFELPPTLPPEPTETINVTIGRVDVRAVFSAQAPKAAVRAASTSSLDDYLKQRSEGRR